MTDPSPAPDPVPEEPVLDDPVIDHPVLDDPLIDHPLIDAFDEAYFESLFREELDGFGPDYSGPDDSGPDADDADAAFLARILTDPNRFDPSEPAHPLPDVASLPTFEQRQEAFAGLLDDASGYDRAFAQAAADRLRRVHELQQYSLSVAAVEEEEFRQANAARGYTPDAEAGWSISHMLQRELVTEVAAAFTLGLSDAEMLVAEASTFIDGLPATFADLAAGEIRYEHAQAMATAAWKLPQETWAALEREALPFARTLILAKFRAKLRKIADRLDPTPLKERHEKAMQFRKLTLQMGDDGMGDLNLHASNEVLAAAYNRITKLASARVKGDDRMLGHRRADMATEILLKGDLCASDAEAAADAAHADTTEAGDAAQTGDNANAGYTALAGDGGKGGAPFTGIHSTRRDGKSLGHGIRAEVHVIIPMLTLLGKSEETATLEGTIPLDPVTARALVADAPSLYRLLTDPVTGSVLAFDDKARFLPASLRRAVRIVDAQCSSPWCDKLASECDGHHPEEWAKTHNTSLDNSALVCPHCHRIVHNTRWTMIRLPDGEKRWVSPCGRITPVAPAMEISPDLIRLVPDLAPPKKKMNDTWAQAEWSASDPLPF
jgi:hypothetical protein